MSELLRPDWQLPAGVVAAVTRRSGGCSSPPWQSFNLAAHVGDEAVSVAGNRQKLLQQLSAVSGVKQLAIQWLEQVHGNRVFTLDETSGMQVPQADALITSMPGMACAVLTADCLPVLFCADDASQVAVAHAGWRGLAAGILENTLRAFALPPERILAWMGPAIGPCHFEVGAEVREEFLRQAAAGDEKQTQEAFKETVTAGKYLGNLYRLAEIRLQTAGVRTVCSKPVCTVCDEQSWFSYRRDGETGRFATLIMLTGND